LDPRKTVESYGFLVQVLGSSFVYNLELNSSSQNAVFNRRTETCA